MCLFLFFYVTHSITILKRAGVFVVVCRKQSLQEYSRLSTQIRWCRSTSVPSYSGWDVSSPAEPRDPVRRYYIHTQLILLFTLLYIVHMYRSYKTLPPPALGWADLFIGGAAADSPLYLAPSHLSIAPSRTI